MTDTTNPLRDTPFMEALLDLVIPPSRDGAMPGAGNLGLKNTVAASVEADVLLGPAVAAGLRAVCDAALAIHPVGLPALSPGMRLEVVREVLGKHPTLMNALARHLYPAYYQHPAVLDALGEPARPPFPEGFQVEPTDARLLAELHARRKVAGQP